MEGIIFSLLLGAIFGSYLNVWVDRIPRHESIHYPGSHCTHCGHNLTALDLIPVLSYFLLKGKCRYCGKEFSGRQAFVEALVSLLFVLAYIKWGFSPMLFTMDILILFLIALSLIDIDTMKLPTIIIFNGLLIETVVKVYECVQEKNINLLIAAIVLSTFTYLIGYFIYWLSSKILHRECFGMGDIRLFAMIIFFITPSTLIVHYIFIGIILLSFLFIVIRYLKSRSLGIFPFGPFISLATLIVCFLYQ